MKCITPSLSDDALYLLQLVADLEAAGREGAERDEPEGSRYIMVSDTLAVEIAKKLGDIADRIDR